MEMQREILMPMGRVRVEPHQKNPAEFLIIDIMIETKLANGLKGGV
jgi:hypothetical protein